MHPLARKLDEVIRNIPDFPKEGIVFKDITPVLQDFRLMSGVIRHFAQVFKDQNIDVVVGIESRGFIFASPLAIALEASFVPVRKPGKLPADVLRQEYELEYGSGTLEIHADAIKKGQRVVIIDDLLATGGTLAASKALVEKLGGRVVACGVMVDLAFLNGAEKLNGTPVEALLSYQS